jgi:hypothetical protein
MAELHMVVRESELNKDGTLSSAAFKNVVGARWSFQKAISQWNQANQGWHSAMPDPQNSDPQIH